MDPIEPLLTAEETAALLQAMRSANVVEPEGPPAESIDLTAQDRHFKLAMPRAERALAEAAIEVRKTLRRQLNAQSLLQPLEVDVTPFGMLSANVPMGSAIAELQTKSGSHGLLVIGPGLVSYVLHRRLGADIEAMEMLPPRLDLSAVDRRVLKSFVAQMAAVYSLVLSGKDDTFSVTQIISRTSDLSPGLQIESFLRMPLSLTLSRIAPEDLTFALAPAGVRELLAKIEPITAVPKDDDDDRVRLTTRLGVAEVDLRAVLGRTRSSVRTIIDLKVGDVIRLSTVPDEPLTVLVSGVPKFKGMPVVQHGNMAVKITDAGKPEGS